MALDDLRAARNRAPYSPTAFSNPSYRRPTSGRFANIPANNSLGHSNALDSILGIAKLGVGVYDRVVAGESAAGAGGQPYVIDFGQGGGGMSTETLMLLAAGGVILYLVL